MKLKFESNSKAWTNNIIEYKQLTDIIFCYKRTQTSNKKSLIINKQGFIKTDKKLTINYENKIINLSLALNEGLEGVRKNGWWLYEIPISKVPFDDFGNKEYSPVRLDYSGHMIFDIEDNPLPVGVYYDYIYSNMSNGVYNLENVLKVLKKRDDIKFVTTKFENIGIKDIPYYNSECGKDKFLEFYWQPDIKSYRKAWEVCLTYGVYPSTKFHIAIADLDLLGIEEHRKEKPYWKK